MDVLCNHGHLSMFILPIIIMKAAYIQSFDIYFLFLLNRLIKIYDHVL